MLPPGVAEVAGVKAVYRMRALVRVLPLFAAAAQFTACSSNTANGGPPGGTRYAAVASPVESAPARTARAFPDRALLARQPEPQCELKDPPADVRPEEAHVATVDWERQCYRQLADIVHGRLTALQDATDRSHALGPHAQALMRREPPPHCDAAKPPAGPPEARAAALDTERQCYRELAAGEATRLEALQDAVRKASATSIRRSGARPPSSAAPAEQYMTY